MGVRPLLFLSKRKEMCTHTETSSTVLFIRGANLETASRSPVTREGDSRQSTTLWTVPRVRRAVRKEELRLAPRLPHQSRGLPAAADSGSPPPPTRACAWPAGSLLAPSLTHTPTNAQGTLHPWPQGPDTSPCPQKPTVPWLLHGLASAVGPQRGAWPSHRARAGSGKLPHSDTTLPRFYVKKKKIQPKILS